MPKAIVEGLSIGYEIIGDEGARPWAITPGGRYTMETAGVRELATALAELGNRVLIWDRPNTGTSEVCFTGEAESIMHADVLAGLLSELDMAPAVIAGGSAGSRVSMIAASRHPTAAIALALWWISGGPFGLMTLGTVYCSGSIHAVWNGGMEAVVQLPEWQEVLTNTPTNRQKFLDQDSTEFLATFERWMLAYYPHEGEVVPGLSAADATTLTLPTLVFRSGASDMYHPRRTSEHVAAVLPNADLVEPPWPDTEWIDRMSAGIRAFPRWPLLAEPLDRWARETLS